VGKARKKVFSLVADVLDSNRSYVEVKKELECQAILTAEYRCVHLDTYLSVARLSNLISAVPTLPSLSSVLGAGIFNLVSDHHRQRDAV